MKRYSGDYFLERYRAYTESNKKGDKLEDTTDLLNKEKLKNVKQDRSERKKYANRTFIFLCFFTSFVLLVVFLAGFTQFTYFEVSDTVLITLITTSFATVVGTFLIVMRYLFSNKDK